MRHLEANNDQSKIIKSIFTHLTIGLLIIGVSIYVAHAFVNDGISECYYSTVSIGAKCLGNYRIWFIVGLILILSVSVAIGANLVIRHMVRATRLYFLLLAAFAFLTFYPTYTIRRVNTDLDFCQQRLSNLVDSCRAHTNEMHFGHYVISLHTVILGIVFLATFFYLRHKRQGAGNSNHNINEIGSMPKA